MIFSCSLCKLPILVDECIIQLWLLHTCCCVCVLPKPGKTQSFLKSPIHRVFGFHWVLDFIGFSIFLFKWAVGKLVGWFSSSAKLLFRFTSTLDYLKVCKFITYWSLEAVNIKKSVIITGITNWSWIKFGAGFLLFFLWVLPPKTTRCLNPVPKLESDCFLHLQSNSNGWKQFRFDRSW